jgi:hypothetical protein
MSARPQDWRAAGAHLPISRGSLPGLDEHHPEQVDVDDVDAPGLAIASPGWPVPATFPWVFGAGGE